MLFCKFPSNTYSITIKKMDLEPKSDFDMKIDVIVDTFHQLADDSFSFKDSHHYGLRGNTMMTLTFDGDSRFEFKTESEDIARYFEKLAFHKHGLAVKVRQEA